MKLIDILNKIANDEELPEKIMFFGHEFIYDETIKTYSSVIENEPIGEMFILEYCLGFKVEIIEENKKPEKVKIIEEKKIPEKLEEYEFDELTKESKVWRLFYKYNELIGYLKSKGD